MGAVKDKCYANKPDTIDALKDNIREAIGEIQLHTIDNMLKNWSDRVGCCMASGGSHFNEIVFIIINRKDYISNKKRNLRKYSVVFLKHFPKQKVFGGPCIWNKFRQALKKKKNTASGIFIPDFFL